jgi:hypothetical protein
MSRPKTVRAALFLGGLAWVMATGAGLLAVHSYEMTPGLTAEFQPVWPAGGRLRCDPGRANLVMLAHPRCPCTRASLEELSQLVDKCRVPLAIHVLFYQPREARERWGPEDLPRRAAAIPGVRVFQDPGGEEAARFGAETSGSVLLYDRQQRLLFAGGITAARGRSGDNLGLEAVIALLDGSAAQATSPVFGCSLRNVSEIREK